MGLEEKECEDGVGGGWIDVCMSVLGLKVTHANQGNGDTKMSRQAIPKLTNTEIRRMQTEEERKELREQLVATEFQANIVIRPSLISRKPSRRPCIMRRQNEQHRRLPNIHQTL